MSEIENFPITAYLDEICQKLKSSQSHSLVLTAETGAGKSTIVPLALLKAFSGQILMLEPRRLAALAVAGRVAHLLGEDCGQTAGYVMHLEKNVSPKTRFTVMTEAVLTKRLLDDPALEGVSVVVLDEFHERSVNADLALCFLKEALTLRDDLYVLVMSATIDSSSVATYLGNAQNPAPVVEVPGRVFPIEFAYERNFSVADAVRQELKNTNGRGTILAFLPGIAEIRKTQSELLSSPCADSADICILHSSVSFDEQRKILSPGHLAAKRRVILSSAIAETSVTVPDVTVVIDSGLMRINRMNVAAGMESLVTEKESMFSAKQRAGRAGRTGPGKCIRLWAENDVLPERTPPEILRCDLAQVVLECADWGVTDKKDLDWLDAPGANPWNAAQEFLQSLGCLGADKRITDVGRAALTMGLSPRLACVALAGKAENVLAYSSYCKAPAYLQKRFVSDLERRKALCPYTSAMDLYFKTVRAVNEPLLAGYPDRLARLDGDDGCYKFPSGRVASLTIEERNNHTGFPEWILAPEVNAGEYKGTIYNWKPVAQETVNAFLSGRTETKTTAFFTDRSHSHIKKMKQTCYGKIVLSQVPVSASPADFAEALCSLVEAQGLDALPLNAEAKLLLLRYKFYCEHKAGEKEKNLALSVREWLPPFVTAASITEHAVLEALRYELNARELDEHVPVQITLSNGKRFTLVYEAVTMQDGKQIVRPVLEVIIQRLFGCFATPRVMGVPVLLKLLSPARRPLQVTDDLEHFWGTTWTEICKEMKGRYPKHNWDYRVIENE